VGGEGSLEKGKEDSKTTWREKKEKRTQRPHGAGRHASTGREWVAAAVVEADGSEALVEASDDVEDEGAVSDVLVKIAKVLGHPLVAVAILGDGRSPCWKELNSWLV
jgi:hypothetical protein